MRCIDPTGQLEEYTDQSYAYCPADETVYLGQRALWHFYDGAGDAGPIVGIAHEWGHHVQSATGVPAPRTPDEWIVFENQADCIAGAWTGYADDQDRLTYPDDLDDIGALMRLIGSVEGPERDHGTTPERTKSFIQGFRGGLSACNEFHPATPIITS